MADLTDERLKEMEEEMNRFEEEILTTQDGPSVANDSGVRSKKVLSAGSKVDIAAVTLERVQAHLANKPLAPPPPPPPPTTTDSSKTKDSIPKNILAAAALIPPPPPPPIGPKQPENAFVGPRMAPPPPPPPGFLPPQLRHRPPMAPPPRMPMHMMHGGSGGPPMNRPFGPPRGMMAPPPPPPHMLGGPPAMPPGAFHRPMMLPATSMPVMRPPPMQMNNQPPSFVYTSNYPPVTISEPVKPAAAPVEQPKIVYSAAPVRANSSQPAKKGSDSSFTPTSIKKKAKLSSAEATSIETKVVSGIELNVPIEKIEAEKQQAANVAMPAPAAEAVAATPGSGQPGTSKKEKEKKKKFIRMAAGSVWEDTTLAEWGQDDFRLFCGDLGNEVTDDILMRAFNRYPSFQKARVIRDKRSQKTKGFGFVSFKDPNDFARAMREMNGKYVGNRPIKLRKSVWQDRQIDCVKKKEKEKKRLGFR